MAGKRADGEGALFQRKTGRHKGKWIARVPIGNDENGHIKKVSYQFKTQAEAKDKLRDVLNDLAKGRQPITKSQRLEDYLDAWLEQRVKPNKSPNTYDRYRSAVTVHIKPDAISKLVLPEIRVSHVRDLLARRAKAKAGDATLFNIRATLSAAMQQAVRDELIHENPVRKSESPRQTDKAIKYLDLKQVKMLVDASADHEVATLVLTAIYTGMRMSELVGLTWEKIDFKRNTITIDQQLQRHEKAFYLAPLKTRGGRRTIPMASAVADKLKVLKGATVLASDLVKPAISGLVFAAPSGQPYHRKTILSLTNALMKKAEVPEIGFHALRHTCASILINGGADALRVQRQLGHSSVRMTLETYSHLFEERLQGNIDIIDQALGAPTETK